MGVLAAVSVATACLLPEGPAARTAELPPDGYFSIKHPTGAAEVFLDIASDGTVRGAGTIRTARKIIDGLVFSAADGLSPELLPACRPPLVIGRPHLEHYRTPLR